MNKKKIAIILVAVFLWLCFFGTCISSLNKNKENSNSKSNSITELTQEQKDSIRVADSIAYTQKSFWQYSEDVDQMTSKSAYFATLQSVNDVEFKFPYNGGSNLILVVRKHPKYGTDVYIKITKGQFNHGINGAKILVRFDDAQPVTYSCNTPSDNSSDLLFINDAKGFIKKLKNSKQCKIQAEFFNGGNPVFTFITQNFEWNH